MGYILLRIVRIIRQTYLGECGALARIFSSLGNNSYYIEDTYIEELELNY